MQGNGCDRHRIIKASDTILHSRADDVVPFADSQELVRNSGLPAYTPIETGMITG